MSKVSDSVSVSVSTNVSASVSVSVSVHIIWTGGEPTIKGHQQSIVNFTNYWLARHLDNTVRPYYEIETNGTVYIDEPLFKMLDQINCSPKLANSGMTKSQRFNEAALKRIMEHKNYQFK